MHLWQYKYTFAFHSSHRMLSKYLHVVCIKLSVILHNTKHIDFSVNNYFIMHAFINGSIKWKYSIAINKIRAQFIITTNII